MRTADPLHPHVTAVCSGKLEVVGEGRAAHRSGIRKRPHDGVVVVDRDGVPGDRIGDTEHHGGRDQALYVYAGEDADWWAEQLGRPLPAGAFGENLRTRGVDPNQARIGERWRIGTELEVEVTAPRIPCATLAAAWDEPSSLIDRFLRAGRPGTYLRVVTPGRVAADDPVDLIAPAIDAPTVAEVSRILSRERHRAAELRDVPGLAHRVADWAREVTGRPRVTEAP